MQEEIDPALRIKHKTWENDKVIKMNAPGTNSQPRHYIESNRLIPCIESLVSALRTRPDLEHVFAMVASKWMLQVRFELTTTALL